MATTDPRTIARRHGGLLRELEAMRNKAAVDVHGQYSDRARDTLAQVSMELLGRERIQQMQNEAGKYAADVHRYGIDVGAGTQKYGYDVAKYGHDLDAEIKRRHLFLQEAIAGLANPEAPALYGNLLPSVLEAMKKRMGEDYAPGFGSYRTEKKPDSSIITDFLKKNRGGNFGAARPYQLGY